jgi:hypothetical protein
MSFKSVMVLKLRLGAVLTLDLVRYVPSMAAFAQDFLTFVTDETSEVEEAMRELSARGDGIGWVNIGPALTEEQYRQVPEPSTLGSWFSARGPVVPLATWTPSVAGAKPRPVTVGIEHGAGPKAIEQLRDAGLPLPAGWRKLQDHAKRGIVVEVPASSDHRLVLAWLVKACWALCGIEIDDQWSAVVNRPES